MMADRLSVTLTVGTAPWPYGLTHRRAHGLFTYGLFQNPAVGRWVGCRPTEAEKMWDVGCGVWGVGCEV